MLLFIDINFTEYFIEYAAYSFCNTTKVYSIFSVYPILRTLFRRAPALIRRTDPHKKIIA